MARLLFIAHEASRTGACIQLRDLLRWVRANTRHEITTLLLRGGELVDDFAAVGLVVKAYATTEVPMAARALRKLLSTQPSSALDRAAAQLRRQPKFDLLYANTTVAGVAMGVLQGLARRCIAHVHEMPTLISSFDARAIAAMRQHADRVLVPSTVAATGLCEELGFEPERISVLPAFVADCSRPDLEGTYARQRVRDAAGLPADAWVVGVCGTGVFHKGTDLLPRLTQALPETVAGRPVHLVHVGQFDTARHRLFIERDARLLGVGNRLHLLGPSDDAAGLMAGFDVHLLPSREESFGLVVLESAALGIPSVCFDGASGAADFCAHGAGVTVSYLNADAMAAAACELLIDSNRRQALGAAARANWMRGHCIETAMPKWLDIVKKELALANR